MQVADFALSLPSEDEDFDDIAEVAPWERQPQSAQLGIGQNSFPRSFEIFVCCRRWIGLDQSFAQGPVQKAS